MKLIHLSDLHLGKRVNEFSMIEDQKYVLDEIVGIIDRERPEGVIVAGDVYDKSVPSAEAVTLFDDFLAKLAARKIKTFVVSGNHDSAERIAFGSKIMDASGIFLSPVYDGKVAPIALSDDHGELNVYMLPFLKPAHVRRFFGDEGIETYTDAMRRVVEEMRVDKEKRNVLITHQFVTGASRSESEEISVGGADNVDGAVFEAFDYVALGHIHSPQYCGSEKIRYCGTPLKYSFSEAKDEKSVSVVELGPKGSLVVRTVSIKPLRDMAELKGKYDELMAKSYYEGTTYGTDYVHITLTDEEDVVDAVGRLRSVYKNLMKLDYDNARTRCTTKIDGAADVEKKAPLELLEDLYVLQNDRQMSDEQRAFATELIEKIWGEEE